MRASVRKKLQAIVGPGGWESDPVVLEPNLTEWRGVVHGKTPMMVSPQSREQVADVVRLCAVEEIGIVPQGGNTGMCAGAVPDSSGTQLLLSLARLRTIRSLDRADYSMVVESGCILADVQSAAREAGLFFPLSHGGEGSCQIGGLSTNAGGINVLRYGTARDQVLGLEVVLADGTIWDGLKTLRKDTAGYDLKQVFIGSEGTLGVITAAAVKLLPPPGETATALVGCEDIGASVALLGICREQLADQVQAFELIGARAFELVLSHIAGARLPLGNAFPWYVLIEATETTTGETLQRTLSDSVQRGLIGDAVIAKSIAESLELWRLRHSIPEAQKKEGAGIKHDISLPIASIEAFVAESQKKLRRNVSGIDTVIFGHVGDGNLHYNALLPEGLPADEIRRLRDTVSDIVYGLVTEYGGSISAEHGIGVLKKPYLERYKSDVELGMMRSLKAAFNPKNILNPGKVI